MSRCFVLLICVIAVEVQGRLLLHYKHKQGRLLSMPLPLTGPSTPKEETKQRRYHNLKPPTQVTKKTAKLHGHALADHGKVEHVVVHNQVNKKQANEIINSHGIPTTVVVPKPCISVAIHKPKITVGDRVLARWTNNFYYTGKVSSTEGGNIRVLFDDGDEKTHKVHDVSAVVKNSGISHVRIGQHVLANWHGGVKYYIGYVTAKASNDRYTITFDDNDEASYHPAQLTEFPDHRSAYEEGARVFVRRTNGLYYRGFVTSVSSTTIDVKSDDGDTITLPIVDREAVVLDKLDCDTDVGPGQRVIGFWPGKTWYYPGVVQSTKITGSPECFQKEVYDVVFDDGDKRSEDFNQIRPVPYVGESHKEVKPVRVPGCRLERKPSEIRV